MPAPLLARVSVRDLAKRYGPVEALKGISFEVAEGEIFGLLGPNGAGKTTALECLLGLRRPDSGCLFVSGRDALAHPEEAKERVGAQIQGATLQDKITPRQALALFASFYRAPASVGDLIERFALGAKADAPFDSLSGGQRQRLFLALAFVNDPALVVLDEPTAGLDPRARRELHDMIRGLRAAGRTVLMSTHDLDEAGLLCDRIAILDAGRIVATAAPGDLVAASGASPVVRLRTTPPLSEAQVGALPGVTRSALRDGAWVLDTADLTATVAGIGGCVESTGVRIIDLQVARPSLEDVFLSLTGRAWAAGPAEGSP